MHDNVDWTSSSPPNGLDVFRQLLLQGNDRFMPEEREKALMQQELLDLAKANKRMQEELHMYSMQQPQQHQYQRRHSQSVSMGQLDAQFDQMAVVSVSNGGGDGAGNNMNMSAQPTAPSAGTPIHGKQQIKLTPPEMSRSQMPRC